MREAVIVASSRTALTKSFRGSFNITRPDDQTAHCIKDVLRKTPQLDPKEVEDVVIGCGTPQGPQGHNIARIAAMLAGLPTSVPGTTINRYCSSGLQAIALAAYQIINGGCDAIIGGGVESISLTKPNPDPNPQLLEKMFLSVETMFAAAVARSVSATDERGLNANVCVGSDGSR